MLFVIMLCHYAFGHYVVSLCFWSLCCVIMLLVIMLCHYALCHYVLSLCCVIMLFVIMLCHYVVSLCSLSLCYVVLQFIINSLHYRERRYARVIMPNVLAPIEFVLAKFSTLSLAVLLPSSQNFVNKHAHFYS
jgi:hypothetical protein